MVRRVRATWRRAFDHRRVLLKRTLRGVGAALAWALVALVALVSSLVYHLQLDLAGVVAVEAVTELLDREIRGSIEIGELHNVTYEKIVARGVVIRDPDGNVVIRANRVAAWPNFGALATGVIYVDRVRLRRGLVTLIPSGTEESPSVSIAETFLPVERPGDSDGPPDSDPIHVVIDGIVIDEVNVRGDVPGFRGLRVEDVRAEGRVDVRGPALIRVHRGRADVTGPYHGRITLDNIVGAIDTRLTREDGLEFWSRGHFRRDRFRALFSLWQEEIAEDETETHMDLRVRFDPVRMASLAELQVAPGLENLRGTFRGSARLRGPVSDLRLSAEATSDAGHAYASGRLPSDGPLVIDGHTDGPLRLERLVPVAPELRLQGRGRVTITPREGDDSTIRIHSETEPFVFGEVSVPAAMVDAEVLDESLEIEDLVSSVAGGHIAGNGAIGFDGSLDLHLAARLPEISREPNVRRFAPEAAGSLDTDLNLRADEALSNLRVQGRLRMRNARYGAALRASSLNLRGEVSGELPAPTVHATGGAEGLRVGEVSLGTATLRVDGGPGGYTLAATAADPRARTRVEIEGRATSQADLVTLDTTQMTLDLGDGRPWQGQLGLTVRPGESLQVRPLRLRREDESVMAEGTYRFDAGDDFEVTAENLELAQLRRFAPDALEGLTGELDAHVVVSGDVDTRPQGRARLTLRDGGLRGVDDIQATAELDLAGDQLRTDTHIDLGDDGRVSAQGQVRLSAASLRDPARLRTDADLSGLQITTDNLSVAPILALAGSDPFVSGRITTSAALGGTIEHPEIAEAILILDRVGPEDWDPLRLKAHLRYTGQRVQVRRFWLANLEGELATGRADLPLSLVDPPSDLRSFWRSLHTSTWSAYARLPPRRLDSWPRPLRDSLPPGILLAAEVDAVGDSSGPRATYSALARVVEVLDEEARCSTELDPHMTLEGRLDGSVATGTVYGYTGSDVPVVEGTLVADLPLDEWITAGDVMRFPGTQLRLRLRGAEMSAIPYACSYGSGPVFGTVTAKNVLTDAPVLGAVLELPRLQVWERAGDRGSARLTEAFRVHARAGSTEARDALTACVVLGLSRNEGTPGSQCRTAEGARDGELISRLRVPVTWTGGQALPTIVEDGELSSWSDFNGVHVAPVVGFIPGVVAGDAVLRGTIAARGPWDRMRMTGELDVDHGHVQIAGLGQHLHGITGRIELNGDEALFPVSEPLRALDSGGTAEVSGRVGFEGLLPRDVDLSVSTRGFPIRREGMVLAALSGAATIGGTISEDATTTTITTHGFSIRLPERTASTLQPTELHPEVLVVGSERVGGPDTTNVYAVRVRIDARDGFWVTRNDFRVRVNALLTATYQDPELRLGGLATIDRGDFEIFGKSFELREGSIQFGRPGRGGRTVESAELDPQVNVVAVYDIPGRSGETVTVLVSGSLTHPRVQFRSTVTNDRAEIISLLVAGARREGGTASQAAEEQATSFLAGLTAGILTLGLRQELGDVIPVLAIESQGLGGTRIRAGFTANDLIPDFLREVIVGAYVEGFVTAAAEGTNAGGSSAGNGGVGGGVTVEFTFPDDFLLRGTYVPVDNGSLDLVYEP